MSADGGAVFAEVFGEGGEVWFFLSREERAVEGFEPDAVERDNDNRQEVGDNLPDETQVITEPQNEQTDSVTTEVDSSDQRQPYPYYLRPLPGRRNSIFTDH